jgi:AcrR family transcriptional regulator
MSSRDARRVGRPRVGPRGGGSGVNGELVSGRAHARAAPRPGPNGLGRERVAEIQRARIISAAVEVTRERGASEATVARVVARAGMSRRTFYELFEDREDCFLAAFDYAVAKAAATVIPAYQAQGAWREQIRAGLTALLGFLDDEPGLGALVVVDALGAGPQALKRRARVLETLIQVVDEGRIEGKVGQERPPLTAEGVVGAVFSVIHARMLEQTPLAELVNPLMSVIVMPYFGANAARRELHRPVAKTRRAPRPRQDPLKDLDMRLTYRTVCVLMAIAADPGVSNRQVAERAGIIDQGQMSRLLTRLDNLGLIDNTGQGHAHGEPNAWTLTPKGQEVEQAIKTEPSHT